MLPKVKIAAKTDKGLVRPGNEDYLHVDMDHRVFAVFDGMGGHQAGEVASMTAAQTVQRAFGEFSPELAENPGLDLGRTLPPSGDLLLKSIRLANRMIHNRALEETELSGMGTTVVATALEADIMSVAHVGDSRAYRLGAHQLEPLTKDHSWLVEVQEAQQMSEEEASSFVSKNVITRALGVRDTVEVDYRVVKITAGDIFVLCSDGLCGFADDDDIFAVARKSRDDIDRMAADLVQMANDRGGSDNVTIVVIQVDQVQESQLPELDVLTLEAEPAATLTEEDIWVTRFAELDAEEAEQQDPPSQPTQKKTNPLVIILLLVVFAVVFWLIYRYSGVA
ncbi:MAG: serine/threonine-protein phosphatase [Candidatus Zixiibacteriota bacterium]|nr:MAG: serine/threonine-protein phosphatase [candidate division Zixibacteria bacterium]